MTFKLNITKYIPKKIFADDLLVFTKPETQSLLKFKQVIGDFAKVSGLHINNSKSVIYIAGVPRIDVEASIFAIIDVSNSLWTEMLYQTWL